VNQYRLRDSEPTVLVAEDDNLTRELLFKTLKKDGWLVQLAVNGRDALDKLLTFQPQLILLDLMMPELGGFGVIEELGKREHWRRIPVIVLTAKDITPEDRQRLDSHTGRILRQEPQTRLQMQTEVRRQIRDALGRQPLRFPGAAMER
jgi:CheY-like chemotaxis protein